ncbi:unnamed protein product [Phytophthora fragariaefolia]|uniref:Unnamed protein product n=1 Tax=Phytophthora fragariaefolia TaxID=1490495 RepID=A0A9W6XL30_9STRA|nr:unnamed protein product [Phytophthora fragariaefolia]
MTPRYPRATKGKTGEQTGQVQDCPSKEDHLFKVQVSSWSHPEIRHSSTGETGADFHKGPTPHVQPGCTTKDPECLDAYGYWSPVSKDSARKPSDTSVGVDFTSSYELEVFRPRPARWTHRADLHPLGFERMESEAEELKQLVTEGTDALSAKSKKERFDEQSWDSLKSRPLYEVLREYKDVLPDDIPVELPQAKGVQHVIDLVPGTKYCVTLQWPLPREQVKATDDLFESRRKAGQVRESNSPHSAPMFCGKKAQDGWRIVHAYNKLNDATVPAQTPVPRKDVVMDSMVLSTIFSS